MDRYKWHVRGECCFCESKRGFVLSSKREISPGISDWCVRCANCHHYIKHESSRNLESMGCDIESMVDESATRASSYARAAYIRDLRERKQSGSPLFRS